MYPWLSNQGEFLVSLHSDERNQNKTRMPTTLRREPFRLLSIYLNKATYVQKNGNNYNILDMVCILSITQFKTYILWNLFINKMKLC